MNDMKNLALFGFEMQLKTIGKCPSLVSKMLAAESARGYLDALHMCQIISDEECEAFYDMVEREENA